MTFIQVASVQINAHRILNDSEKNYRIIISLLYKCANTNPYLLGRGKMQPN